MCSSSIPIQPLRRPDSPLALPHLIQPVSNEGPEESPEDIVASSLSLLDPLNATNQHGDPGTCILYNSRNASPLVLQLSDPGSASERWLFAQYVWNAGILLAECIGKGWWWQRLPANESASDTTATVCRTRSNCWSVKGEDVLELGAGSGLVGLCAMRAGARKVTLTDYPAKGILAALESNLKMNGAALNLSTEDMLDGSGNRSRGHSSNYSNEATATKGSPKSDLKAAVVQGHEWGCFENDWSASNRSTFTRVIAADTLWMESAHAAQAESMAWFLKSSPTARVWVVGGFHTGRAKVRSFLEDAIPKMNLSVIEAWEVDVAGLERDWSGHRHEGPGEAARWCVVAIIGWKHVS